MQANMNAMQKGEFRIIALSIIDKTNDESPEFEAPTFDEDEEYDFDCKMISSEKTKVNSMNSFKSIIECNGDSTSMKGKSHHFATNDKWIMLIYASSPSSDFDKDVSNYDSAVNTIKISNSVDFNFEIPEDLKDSSYSNTTDYVQEDNIQSEIPDWIRTNATWWAGDQIDDQTFVSGIQFLIKEGILSVPETQSNQTQEISNEIPGWVKNNADWGGQGLLTDDDFLKGIQYLVEQGIIQV